MNNVQMNRLHLFQFDEENPKDHNIGTIMQSIQRHGFVELPVINDTTGLLVAGHGRIEALQIMAKENPTEPPKFVLQEKDTDEWLVPTIHVSFATDAEAKAYMIASNSTVIDGGWHENKLLDMLMDINNETKNLLGTGFTNQDVVDMLDYADAPLKFDDDLGEQTHSVIVKADNLSDANSIKNELEELGYQCQVKTTTK